MSEPARDRSFCRKVERLIAVEYFELGMTVTDERAHLATAGVCEQLQAYAGGDPRLPLDDPTLKRLVSRSVAAVVWIEEWWKSPAERGAR